MKIHRLISLALLSTLTGCGSETADAAVSVAGHWAQNTDAGAPGMTLEFDAASDRMMVHTAPAPDGSHGHLSGTYTLDAVAKTVTVNCALLGTGSGEAWQGLVDGERLTLTSGETTLTFDKGANPHEGK